MPETIEETITPDAEVVNVEVKKEDTKTEVNVEKLLADLENMKQDNFKQRESLRTLKATLAEAEEARVKLEAVKAEWEAQLADKARVDAETNKLAALDKASITDEAARKLALKLLTDYEDAEEGIKHILSEYPLLATKSTVILPDTGKAKTVDANVSDNSKLLVGLAKLINK